MDEKVFITEEGAQGRLDKFLAEKFPEQSREYFQYLIEKNAVLVDGKEVKKRHEVKPNQEITVTFELLPEMNLVAEKMPLDLIYEDAYLLVVNKPAGLVVHPAPGNWTGTLANGLLYHCQALQDEKSWKDAALRPGIVHRLDKDTSGLMVVAKDIHTHRALIEQFSSRKTSKQYLAICAGKPRDGEICNFIGRHPIRRQEMAVVRQGGKEAKSVISTLASKEGISLVLIDLKTGRTHQARVHLRALSAPILGDAVYGILKAGKFTADRQLLHAYKLGFYHPKTEQLMEFSAPPPSDFDPFLSFFKCETLVKKPN